MKSIVLVITIGLWISCVPQNKKENEGLELPFKVVGADAAMPFFQKGLLLLHNFEYVDAAEAFIEAQKLDSNFVMAYWGEAMAYNHPVWQNVDVDKARAALQRIGNTPEARLARASTQLEKDFIRAVDILFGEGSKPDRDNAYMQFMKTLHERYPGNHEAAAFYTLSILGIKQDWRNWEDLNAEAAEIAKAILKENPKHPGALHYLIHADDHPDHAKKALDAANKYAKVASYAGHALHMPSHIYLSLGMWDEVVSSNEVSWQAGVDRKESKALNNDELNYHAHLWLQYGYLQQGKHSRARTLLKNQIRYNSEYETARSRFHLLRMKGHYLFETGRWDDELADITMETSDMGLPVRSVSHLINGVRAYHQKEEAALMSAIQGLTMDILNANQLKKDNENITICGVTSYANRIPSLQDIQTAEMVRSELQGLLAWMKNDLKGAEKFFREAIANDDTDVTGPPDFLKLSQEYLGEFLLATNRPAEALELFDAALKLAPNRLSLLKGKLEAARKTDNKELIESLEKQIAGRLIDSDRLAQGV